MGPHILPSSNILESEGLAQSQALGVGGLLRVWHEHVWPLGSVRAGKPPPQISSRPHHLICGAVFTPPPPCPPPFTPGAAKGFWCLYAVRSKRMEVLKYQPPVNSELLHFTFLNEIFPVYNSVYFSVATDMGNHHHSWFGNIFVTSQRNPVPLRYHPPIIPSLPLNQPLIFLSL